MCGGEFARVGRSVVGERQRDLLYVVVVSSPAERQHVGTQCAHRCADVAAALGDRRQR